MDYIDFKKIFSVSKLELFEKCPKAFHFSYLDPIYSKMKSKLRKEPAYIWPFQTLGKSVHDAITLFEHLEKEDKNLQDLKDQLKNSWRSEAMGQKLPPLGKWGGFKTLEEEREVYKKALELLSNFYKTYDSKKVIKYLPTKDLLRSIEDYKSLRQPISEDYDISGKFDLIQVLADGNLEVVDFKTSKDEKYNNFQLRFYKLLAELNFKTPVSKASFYYLRTASIREFELKDEDIKEIKDEVLDKINKISITKDFEPNTSKLCQYCIFQSFCPAYKKVGKIIAKPLFNDFADDLPF